MAVLPSPSPVVAWLLLVKAEEASAAGTVVALSAFEPTVTFGRSPQNTLAFGGICASRSHGEISPTSEGFVLRDRGSTSGTFVNDKRVTERVLRPGDRIRAGQNEMLYLDDERWLLAFLRELRPLPSALG